MARRLRRQQPQAICDRSGFKINYSDGVIEPGTGYFVYKNYSDGQYSLVNHPQNKPPPFKEEMKPLPNARPDINQANEADIIVADDSPIDFIVDNDFSPIYY